MDRHGNQANTERENSFYSFQLMLFSPDGQMRELWLPRTAEGFFRFSNEPQHKFLSIFPRDGQWIAGCERPAYFKDAPLQHSYEMPLSDGLLLRVSIEDNIWLLGVVQILQDRNVFHNYTIRSEVQLIIGSQTGCDICCRCSHIASRHAVLSCRDGAWTVQCLDSLYGLYVNGERTERARLQLGDVLFIMGLRIIVGTGILSISSSVGPVSVSSGVLQDAPMSATGYSRYYQQEEPESGENYFNRPPRKRRESKQQPITIEGPPLSMSQKQAPMMLRMGSSMVMGGAAALAGNFMTLISSVVFPFLSTKFTDNQRQEYEKLRLEKYTQYLQEKSRQIQSAIALERQELNQKYPSMEQLMAPGEMNAHLWERRYVDSDFLQLRLGTGTLPFSTPIEYPPRRFELETDALEEKMYRLAQTAYTVSGVPVVVSLTESYVCGFQGQSGAVREFIRQLVIQTAIFHSYDEVKMVFLLDEGTLDDLDELRYLPHVWDDQRSVRMIATNEAEAYTVGEYLKGWVESDISGSAELPKILKKRPYYLIFALNKKLYDSHEIFRSIAQSDRNPGAGIIVAHGALPKECHKIISLEASDRNICTTMGIDGGEDVLFALDICSNAQLRTVARTLANTRLKKSGQEYQIPKTVTFMEMFRAGRVEQLNPAKRWQDNNPVKSLATPVGVGEDGSIFMLDLHEKRQGPHGLVAGMTGSGKSEFIITYILSLAVNYHPHEVSFVLIDYKGGGLTDAFYNPNTGMRLPHLAGTITNLDGASIQRSLMSIESELVRRQKEFSRVSKELNEGSMNIYTYQKLYRAGKVSKPMPHLFIVSDEFAELKQQQPEFMEKLISAARIGRSLGIHLILATQKPSGVVNDQIRSNTKFRVCLRVQERADSMDMLKRPEAAELTDTGRFYLQVGYNEYFAMGQSAWCGAAYEPQDTVSIQRDDAVEFLDTTGHITVKAKPKVRKTDSGMKQAAAVVQYLSDVAKNHGIEPLNLWQPELPKKLDAQDLLQKYPQSDPMCVCLGLLDDPMNQKRYPMTVDFSACENMLIVGEAGSGKTSILQNILISLSRNLSPRELHFYVLDYSSRMMKTFRPLPHCGAVLQEEDEDSLEEFFKLINGLIAQRKKLFSELEVDNFNDARAKTELPLILVVIDNFSGLSASKKGEAIAYALQNYIKNSGAYGVRYIVTSNYLNELSSRIRQELPCRICLHMKDKYDYSDALGCKVTYLPPDIPGRGMYKWGDDPLEFHAALPCAALSMLKEEISVVAAQYPQRDSAQQLPVYSETAEYDTFVRQFRPGRIPLGYARQTGRPVALPLRQFSLLSLYFGNPAGRKPIISNLLYAAQRENMEIWILCRRENSIFNRGDTDSIDTSAMKNTDCLPYSQDNVRLLHNAMLGIMSQRRELLEKHQAMPDEDEARADPFQFLMKHTPPILVLIESVADFCAAMNIFSMMGMRDLLQKAPQRNVYIMGCFDPGIPEEISSNTIFSTFAQQDIILFGGNLDKQNLYVVPQMLESVKQLPYNVALMQYRGKSHSLLMPCGEVKNESLPEDLQDIFGSELQS
jgi:S-DNA-T family DNA segregation ATPase FtsK/SpoIIIE